MIDGLIVFIIKIGYSCEKCKRGYFGDPTRGIPCKKCECPDLRSTE